MGDTNSNMPVLIFANGEMAEATWLYPYLARATAVIAADGGTRHLSALGHLPDVLIGDLDSVSPEVRREMEDGQTRVVTHDRAKEETDLELALRYAVVQYPQAPILIFATLGGRLDQTVANVMLLAHPAFRGRTIELVEPQQRAWLVESATRIHGRVGDIVSLIPLGGDVLVAETSGLRWPLSGERLLFGPARGISNEMTAELATLKLAAGRLLCVHINNSSLAAQSPT
jgi:thiamine pyrophosphokinase